ncbi:MAG: cytochrome c biogenesis protein CcsA [Planctomycetes bacterium]|nr:cytochrome c biogenesis protein CcsA [Planctomycetota bacterium]
MIRSLRVLLVFGALLASTLTAQKPGDNYRRWDPEVVRMAADVPVQEGGRVKPLDTVARFLLLRLNGKRSLDLPGGPDDKVTLQPTEWLLDVLFRPELARTFPHFLVQNSEVLDAIGVEHAGKNKRDRYAWNDLSRSIEKLYRLHGQFGRIDQKKRTTVQEQVVRLAFVVHEFESMAHLLDFAREGFATEGSSTLKTLYQGQAKVGLATLLGKARELRTAYMEATQKEGQGGGESSPDAVALGKVLERVQRLGGQADTLAFFPPLGSTREQPQWMTPADVVMATLMPMAGEQSWHGPFDRQLQSLGLLERAVGSLGDPALFAKDLGAWRESLVALAGERGEYAKVPLEVSYYRWNLFAQAQGFYLLSFVLCALALLWARWKGWHLVLPLGLAVPTLLVVVGVTLRCILRSRPPVSTLYETILFVAGVGTLVAVFLEIFTRRRTAVTLGALFGALGMFLASRHEEQLGQDTMPQLVAVLDTNFWLATHVTTVTIGYAAGLLAAAIAHVYLLGKLFGLRLQDQAFYRSIGRMLYGTIAFGLVFSVVGTILGGIWANYSWGRFWGWDPKENGALMICLVQTAILHGRMGGYLRDFGIAMASIFLGMVVAFSWWHVNLLGVGLHSYGFTHGTLPVLLTFYGIQAGMLGLGAIAWYLRRPAPAAATRAAADAVV